MTLLRNLIAVASLSVLTATPALAHGGHAPVSATAHGPLHLILILGGAFGAGVIAYVVARAVRARRSAI